MCAASIGPALCGSERYTEYVRQMPSIIPNFYSQLTLTFDLDGWSRPLQITCGILPGVGLTAAQQNAACRTALAGTSTRPFHATNMGGNFSLIESKILYRNATGMLLVDIDGSPILGTKVVSATPINTSVIVRKTTLFGGKKFRGRFMVPPMYFNEIDISESGGISNTPWSAYQNLWDAALSTMQSGGVPPVLLHSDGTTPTVIEDFNVNTRIGTIGKRLRP